ncbi:hypothetical protein [Streptacidiphilus sp. P02-A3a]|uniref:hypothetical protein n=1 Tax=Streptacidiphilus sp. P02-A3a TaxID=2704468 RepID=UPI0015FE2ADC|nr:hypothetical protein [Streptacidiphilus sp. P02-A3a]QMU70925.1 hypothetical protein GXP74_24605 [Streptacidiphilus sp. P02-A3a]
MSDNRPTRHPGVAMPPLARPTVVPHIASWEAERVRTELILKPFDRGIGYADEKAGDRDRHGILWRRTPTRVGRGRPEYKQVHARRQREVMTDLRCQVCAGPASRAEAGWLWLLHDDRAVEPPGWPELAAATHPPLCVPCARASTQTCPHLYGAALAVRVADPRLWGVMGNIYAPSPLDRRRPRPVHSGLVPYTSPLTRWVLASQMVRMLHDCTSVDLDEEFTAYATGAPSTPLPDV